MEDTIDDLMKEFVDITCSDIPKQTKTVKLKELQERLELQTKTSEPWTPPKSIPREDRIEALLSVLCSTSEVLGNNMALHDNCLYDDDEYEQEMKDLIAQQDSLKAKIWKEILS